MGSNDLGEAEVDNLEVGLLSGFNHEDVLGLEVPVADAERVQVVQSGRDLVSNSLGAGFGHGKLPLLEIRKEIAS